MPHIPEHRIAKIEALLAVAIASWEEEKATSDAVTMFMDIMIEEMPDVISSIREYNEALRMSHHAMRRNNWHRIKDGRGLVPEPLSAEDAYRLVSDALSEQQATPSRRR